MFFTDPQNTEHLNRFDEMMKRANRAVQELEQLIKRVQRLGEDQNIPIGDNTRTRPECFKKVLLAEHQ